MKSNLFNWSAASDVDKGQDVGVGKSHPSLRKPVESRRLREGIGVLVAGEGAVGMIVGVEKEEIRARGLAFRSRSGNHDKERKEEDKTKRSHGKEVG